MLSRALALPAKAWQRMQEAEAGEMPCQPSLTALHRLRVARQGHGDAQWHVLPCRGRWGLVLLEQGVPGTAVQLKCSCFAGTPMVWGAADSCPGAGALVEQRNGASDLVWARQADMSWGRSAYLARSDLGALTSCAALPCKCRCAMFGQEHVVARPCSRMARLPAPTSYAGHVSNAVL